MVRSSNKNVLNIFTEHNFSFVQTLMIIPSLPKRAKPAHFGISCKVVLYCLIQIPSSKLNDLSGTEISEFSKSSAGIIFMRIAEYCYIRAIIPAPCYSQGPSQDFKTGGANTLKKNFQNVLNYSFLFSKFYIKKNLLRAMPQVLQP